MRREQFKKMKISQEIYAPHLHLTKKRKEKKAEIVIEQLG